MTGLYYNFMPFNLDMDPAGEINKRIDSLEEKIDGSIMWIE